MHEEVRALDKNVFPSSDCRGSEHCSKCSHWSQKLQCVYQRSEPCGVHPRWCLSAECACVLHVCRCWQVMGEREEMQKQMLKCPDWQTVQQTAKFTHAEAGSCSSHKLVGHSAGKLLLPTRDRHMAHTTKNV